MFEFSKIIKKARGAGFEAPREEPAPPQSKARSGQAGPESRADHASSRREPARCEPPPRRDPPREKPLPDLQEREPRGEEVSLKPVKLLFSQQRVQEQIEAKALAPAEPVAPWREERKESAPPDRPQRRRAESSRFVAETGNSLPMHEALALYGRMMDAIRGILRQAHDSQQVDARRLTSLMGEVVSVIGSGDERLIELAVTHLLKEEESYLPQHCVNVAILSLAIGQGVCYDVGKMMELGLTALLHDIGMVAYKDLADLPRALTSREFDRVKEHVEAGQKRLRDVFPALSEAVLSAQHEIHERLDGSGYPAGRRTIHEYAKIIALVDTFESMIHPRPFRSRYSITDVYKRIFDCKKKLEQRFIKVLIDRVGFYPNGAFIQLNTKEVGRVVAQNRRSPLRPVVRILYGEGGQRLYDDDIKDVDMMRFPTLHAVKCFLKEAEGEDGV